MKIALVGRYGDSEIATGPERVARELFIELKNKNIQVVFIEYFFSGYRGSSIFKKLFGKKYFENESIQRLGIFPLLLTIRQKNFDIIHIVNSQRFVLILLLFKMFITGKLVSTFHGFIHNEFPKKHYLHNRYFIDFWVESLLVIKSDIIIFPSILLYDTFNKYYNISSKQSQIIPNGISQIFHSANFLFPRIEDSIKMIFYNGFDTSINRGLSELLELLKDIKCNIELCVIGNRIILNIDNPHIEVSFVEPMSHPDLLKIFENKHLIIKSNTIDSFSILVAECMTLGLIPIVHENIGIKNLIKNEFNGFSYSGKPQNELSVLIDNIYNGAYDLLKISDNARKIYDQLNWTRVTDQYIAAYKRVL